MSDYLYLLSRGYDNQDCSPWPFAVFRSLDQAKIHAQKIQSALTEQHLKNYPNGKIIWSDERSGEIDEYYIASSVKFDNETSEWGDGYFLDEVIQITKILFIT